MTKEEVFLCGGDRVCHDSTETRRIKPSVTRFESIATRTGSLRPSARKQAHLRLLEPLRSKTDNLKSQRTIPAMLTILTMFGERNCTGVLAPAYLSFFTASVSFVFFFVTVAGNLLVCLAVVKDPNRELRTQFNFFVVNLALTDLIVGLILDPISVAVHLKEGLTDGPLGKGIPTIHMSYFISCTASVLSLAALTVDRYIAITCPFYYRAKQTVKKAVTASVVIWIISISLSFVYFKVGYISYAFVFVNTAVILTFCILIVSYARIYRKIKTQFQISTRLQASLNQENAKRKVQENEARVTKAFLLILLVYLLCYTPTCVMIYIMNFCSTCSCYSIHWLRDMQFLFALLNSCLNPFLYAWRLPCFRDAFGVITRSRPRKSLAGSVTTTSKSGSTISLNRLNVLSNDMKQVCAPKQAAGIEQSLSSTDIQNQQMTMI